MGQDGRVHDNRELIERRITRELNQRILPAIHRDRRPLEVRAGPSPDELEPFDVGSSWGEPWTTTWFSVAGVVPETWRDLDGMRIEGIVDLGFGRAGPGFQAEGLVVARDDSGRHRPLAGIHPRRTSVAIDHFGPTPEAGGRVEALIEAAANPWFVGRGYRPSTDGLPETARARPLYRFRTADLVLVDLETEALAQDLDVLDGLMRALPIDQPRRAEIRAAIVAALDAVPDIPAARAALGPALAAWPDRLGSPPHRIVATGHAHIDTAWLWPIRETIRKCTRTFSNAIDLARRHPELVFSCSQAQQYAWIEERHPELFAEIEAAVDRGQWEPVGGMWVEADMNLPSGESLVRQIVLGQRYFESRFGRRCTEVWIPDVFGYPAGLPQVFAAGGMTRFVTQKLSWNKQNRFPHHTFWWEGLDGTRVLTHFPPVDTYNAELTPDELVDSVRRFRDAGWSRVSLMPFGHGDGGGGPTREMLERARRLARLEPGVTMEVGRPSDVFDVIEREAGCGADIPVWRGELYFEMHRGTLTSQLRTKVGNRRCERLLLEAELWEATLAVSGAEAIDESGLTPLAELWPDVLTQQFHDILPGSSIAWVHRDAEAVFERVEAQLRERIDRSITALTAATGPSVVNPSGSPIETAVVVLPADRVAAGSEHAAQRVGDDVAVHVGPIPPFAVVELEPTAPTDTVLVTESSLANGQLAVELDPAGRLRSVVDLTAQREVLPPDTLGAVLELARDQPVEYDAWDIEAWTRAGGRPVDDHADRHTDVTVTADGPLVGRIEVRTVFGPSTAVVTYELRAGERHLGIVVDLDWHHDEHLLSMAFPIDVRTDVAMCDIQFGVVGRPTHPSSPWDAAKFEVCAHRFVSAAEPSFGVAVLNDGRFGHGVFDGAIRVSLARAAKYPDPDADHGEHSVRLALRPHDGDLGDVRQAAERFDRPLRCVIGDRADARAGAVRPTAGPVVRVLDTERRVAPPGVDVDSVKLADDGSGDLIVRLHEHIGDRVELTVLTERPIVAAQRCNLLEEPRSEEPLVDGEVVVGLRPFELVTLRLALARSTTS